MAGNRGGRASSSLTALVLSTYGTTCHLRMPGCLGVATTKDHLIPHSLGGKDTLENLRPSCKRCNSKRHNRVLNGYGARINVIIGPPASGKSTYVTERAKPSDIVIDFDVIARALMPVQQERTHVYPEYVRHVAIGARKAAIDRATRLAVGATIWVIHALPTANALAEYQSLRYNIITIDPGRDVVERRARLERPPYVWPLIARWYASGLAQAAEPEPVAASSALALGSSSSTAPDW